MSGSSITAPHVYLTQEAGELVLRQGVNPNRGARADTRILIIGGGVTGLTVSDAGAGINAHRRSLLSLQNAWALLDAGYSVTVVSDRWASLEDRITSQIAGAL